MRAISVIFAVGALAVTHAFTALPSGLSLGRDHPGALSQQPASHGCQSRRKNDAIKRCALERTTLLRLRAAEMTLGVSAEPPEEDPLADIPAVLMQDADGVCIIAARVPCKILFHFCSWFHTSLTVHPAVMKPYNKNEIILC